MDGGDHHGSLADRRGHPLDGPGAHVTDGEHPGHRGREAVVGDDEPLGVELDARARAAQVVQGSAPIIRKRPAASSRTSRSRAWSRQVSALSRLVPWTADSSERGWTVMRSWWVRRCAR